MRVTLTQQGAHVPWQADEIVTVKIVSGPSEADDYECETLETYPPDLKEKHAAELAAKQVALDAAKAGAPPAPLDHTGEPVPVAEKPAQILVPDARDAS